MPVPLTGPRRNALLRFAFPRRALRVACLSALVAAAAATASASPILYTLSGTFSGSLGGKTFNDQHAIFSLLSDTDAVQTQMGGFASNTAGVSTFQLGKGALATFLSPTFGVESEYGAASFLDGAQSFAAGEYNESTPSNILSEIGVTISGSFVSYGSTPALTSRGNLVLTGASSDVTFSTAIPSSVSPEPDSLLLSGTGLIGLLAAFRRRFQKI